uniref:Chaperone DnaJ C-terminal domain-containing protein n=1 Tax=Panagrolaimus sp. ES5 TaxID=591445 RepID=A0AC34GVJ4_9BILA
MYSNFFEFAYARRRGSEDSDESCECPHHFFRTPTQKRHRKTPTENHTLNVTLEDLYKGKAMKFKVIRTRKNHCQECNGVGVINYPAMKCVTCHGKGKYDAKKDSSKKNTKNNTYKKHCARCDGKGKIQATSEKCSDCTGVSNIRETVFLNVKITPGMRDGQKLTFSGEGDEKDGMEAGDIVFELKCKKHDLFERNGDNLIIKKKIGLSEALCGTSMVIKQLDGRNLLLKKKEQSGMLHSGLSFKINNEGMPIPNGKKRGNLLIQFELDYPSSYFFKDENLYKQLEDALPPKEKEEPLGEEVTLQEYDKDRYKYTNQQKHRNAYDSDEENEDAPDFGPPFECRMH